MFISNTFQLGKEEARNFLSARAFGLNPYLAASALTFSPDEGILRITSDMTEDPSIPGTIHLVDLEGTLRAKHALGDQKDVVLVPTPSEDPDDPLNWSSKRKLLSTACISVYVSRLLLHH